MGKLTMLCSIKNTREDPNTIATSVDKTIHKLDFISTSNSCVSYISADVKMQMPNLCLERICESNHWTLKLNELTMNLI